MASLEDSILKKNVPGRYTSWKDDQDDKLTERQNKKLGPLTCINQGDGGGDSVDDDEIDEDGHGDGGQEDDNNGDDVDDEEFMKRYREKRIQQLKEEHALKQQQKHQNHRPRQQQHQQQEDHHEIQEVSSGSAQAGYIIVDAVPEIDGIEYVNMVNEQQQRRLQQASSGDNDGDNGNDGDNSLVILLYHDLNDDITSKLLSYLASICLRNHTAWTKRNKVKKTQSARNASRQAQQKFPMICRRLNSNATSINIDPIVLPAILIHQNGGVLTHNLTPAIEHLSASSSSSSSPNNNFTQSDVYELLESCNVPLYYNLHDCNDDDDDDTDNDEE